MKSDGSESNLAARRSAAACIIAVVAMAAGRGRAFQQFLGCEVAKLGA
jgi:hypothetical protein